MPKVTFDGPNKLILVNNGETELDFRTDVYSEWKSWVLLSDNSKFLQAISVIGGDPLPGGRFVGSTFFLENGWRMRTWNGDHELTVIGNVYTRTGDPVFVPTTAAHTVSINLTTSSLVEGISTSGSTLTASDVADAVWDELTAGHQTDDTTGAALVEVLAKLKLLFANEI
jgi:hypothetical protein